MPAGSTLAIRLLATSFHGLAGKNAFEKAAVGFRRIS